MALSQLHPIPLFGLKAERARVEDESDGLVAVFFLFSFRFDQVHSGACTYHVCVCECG